MDAEVVDGRLEVRGVGFVTHVQELPRDEIRGESQLLRDGEDFRRQLGDVALQRLPCHVHELPRE